MNTLTPIQNTKHIYDLVALCAEFGVEKAVVCPGSRCAPLLIGFGKHPDIETISVTDEHSAGFIGLGLAQQSEKPVVLVCTSGTAALNFGPAVTEAFYQQVPLIVLTADRPSEWIDQWDGQTIRQENIYLDHIKGNFVYDEENTSVGKEALKLALDGGQGPVHLNIPIREPFYPELFEEIIFPTKHQPALPFGREQAGTKDTKSKNSKIDVSLWDEFESILDSSEKVMVLGGQMEPNSELVELLNQLEILIVGDVISNIHGVDGVIKSADLLFNELLPTKHTKDTKSFQPEFLVTIGRSIISKNLKLYLRKHKPKYHWHIGMGMVGDPFQSLTKTIEVEPIAFIKKWKNILPTKARISLRNNGYKDLLFDGQTQMDVVLNSKLKDADFNYFSAVRKVIQRLPENSVLHLGNSMPVRIANFIGINDPTIDVWCNRGTSGIDGVLSTAVGHALAEQNRKHTLIIGDLSFFYDRNGLWLNHSFPTNLQIVILNDFGGGIFNMIPGPSSQGDLTELFTTPHKRTASLTAKEFRLDYRSASSLEEIIGWEAGILEIFTDMEINKKVFKQIAAN
jgi:2-succinyl-5-enolpyruvyl-6-hydroxy-3-cyclohexene-1-carboxylate synthase